MRDFPNIERLEGRDYYTGYAAGSIWRIRETGYAGHRGQRKWAAVLVNGRAGVVQFYAPTLAAVSDRLTSLARVADADLAEAAGDERCSACGRESLDCSRDPCAAVQADRES